MELHKDCINCSEQKMTTVAFISYGLFLLFFVPPLVCIFFISKDTSEDPLKEGINFYNTSSFNSGSYINACAEAFNLKDEYTVDCNKIYELIKVKNQSLGEIFTLNTGKINSLSKGLIAVKFVTLSLVILDIIIYLRILNEKKSSYTGTKTKKDSGDYCADCCCLFFGCIIGLCCAVFIIISFGILIIVEIILFSIICAKYNNDETKKFLNFLKCDGINHDIISKFSSLNDLSLHFTLIKILNSVYLIFFIIFGIIVVCSQFTDFSLTKNEDGDKEDKEKALSD